MLSLSPSAQAIKGEILTPDHAGYDEARTVFLGTIDRRPSTIVRVADAADVAAVIAVARETGSELAVRSGGHSPAGHGVVDDGIVHRPVRHEGPRDRRRAAAPPGPRPA